MTQSNSQNEKYYLVTVTNENYNKKDERHETLYLIPTSLDDYKQLCHDYLNNIGYIPNAPFKDNEQINAYKELSKCIKTEEDAKNLNEILADEEGLKNEEINEFNKNEKKNPRRTILDKFLYIDGRSKKLHKAWKEFLDNNKNKGIIEINKNIPYSILDHSDSKYNLNIIIEKSNFH